MLLRFIIFLFIFSSSIVGSIRPFVSVELDSGMFVKPYTNRSVAGVTLISHDLINMASWSVNRNVLYLNRKAGFYMRAFLTGLIMNHTYFSFYSLPYQEFGHGSRGRAFGVEPDYYLLGNEGDVTHTYYAFFGDVFSSVMGSKGLSTATKKPDTWFAHSSVDTSDFDLIWYAGGVNNQVYFSQIIDDRFYERNITSVYDVIGFFNAKMAISNLDSVTLNEIRSMYSDKGISLSNSELKRYNGYAVLSSLTFWAFVDGWARYLVSGIDHIQYNEWYNFRLPDVSMYLTSHGPSYRVQSGYRFSVDTHMPIAIEYVFAGESHYELTLGVSKKWSWPLKSYSEIRLGDGVGLTQAIDIVLPSFSKVGVGFDYYNFNNLYGERHILSLKDGGTNINFWLAYSYRK